ncbi:sugar ABC transporter ATP-binding protein [Alginatibacterium sediminis]|uniref:Sugar ABC transporter ATP-binding protein n=1 Tax=Alginatibacterium sediminis TaxID=2164068 RepID=A0A420ECU3_9ALTE|nr:sugar ABC transporter ATP-binding protein [Alginatibacterium sediminis]RKF18485.1 sugar ABC transporter ATP-binding protein [Alginatibacterium sediminis]
MSKPQTALLELRHIHKSFGAVQVLHDINVSLVAGEVLGILGENGAGKSTLLKIISGIYHASSGEVCVDGKVVSIKDASSAKALGIAMIPQEFNLIPSLNVFENIFLGNELKRHGWLDKRTMREKTQSLMALLETQLPSDAMIEDLSVAQKQMVEIAKALVNDARILIMDEPTTVLTAQEADVLFALVDKLKAKGVTVLFISHKLKEVKRLCDRLLIMRDGEVVALEKVSELDEHDMARLMVGRELSQVFPAKTVGGQELALNVSGLTVPNLLSDINLQVHCGEVLGIAGLMGSGRTETAEAIMGLRKRSQGQIEVFGEVVNIKSLQDAVEHKLAYLSEDRQGSGLIMNFDLSENITLISLNKYKKGLIQHQKTRERAEHYRKLFSIKTETVSTPLVNLSGGNQQKVYLSKWMDTEPKILILDEPTRGIDVNTKKEIYHFIRELTEQGIAVIVISSEMEEVIGLAHRVMVMREGKVQGELCGADINEQQIMYLAAGLREQQDSNNAQGKRA